MNQEEIASNNYGTLCEYMEAKQKELGIDYKEHLAGDAYTTVMEYFTGHPSFLERDKSYSFSKGLLVFGPIGCGKTLMMKMFSKNVRANYRLINCREAASDFAVNGDEALSKYFELSQPSYLTPKPVLKSFCFDDLGTEPDKKYYGSDVNVILEIMLRRYDRGEFWRTHATTNLTPEEIRARYGDRLISRFREMFNLVKFPADAKDLRS